MAINKKFKIWARDVNLDGLFQEIKDYVATKEADYDRMKLRLESFNRDSEIQKYKMAYEEIRRKSIHVLSDYEINRISEWFANHRKTDCKCKAYHYELTPTGIGMGVVIVCNRCGYREELNDDF